MFLYYLAVDAKQRHWTSASVNFITIQLNTIWLSKKMKITMSN